MVAVAVEFAKSTSDPWQAITCQVMGAGWSRGASDDRGVFSIAEAGQASVYLIDPARDLDPANPASVFAGQIDVGVPFRISLAGAVAFTGRIDDIQHTLDPGSDSIAIARIAAVDPIAKLAGVQLDWPAFPAETTDARIVRILDGAEVTLRDVQAGGLALQAEASAQTVDAWSLLADVTQNELGGLEVRPDGTLVTRTRRTTWTAAAAALELGCQPGGIPLAQVSIEQARSTIRNRVAAKRTGSATTNVYYSPSSVARYGLRSMSKTDLELTSDSVVMLWAQFVGRRSETPTRAYRSVEVPQVDAAGVAAIEGLLLFTSRVHVRIDGYGNSIDIVLRLLGVSWSIDDTLQPTATLVLGTDWPLSAIARDVTLDTDTQWLTAFPGGSGALYWKIDSGTLKVGSTPVGLGGFASFVLTWNSLG